MILGFASGLPVIAAVAVWDRWNHFVHCPYCDTIHSHGGHGPTSPLGAVDDGRVAHCGSASTDEVRHGIYLLQDLGMVPSMYVLKEVPGIASFRVNGGEASTYTLTYDYAGIAAMRQEISDAIAYYQGKWEGAHRPRGGSMHPADLAFRRGEIPWPAAYVPAPGEPRTKRCAVYLHYDADDVLLYVGITDDPVVRGKRHASRSTWAQFAARHEGVWCDDRPAAERKEVELIKTLRPLFNDKHAAPDRNERLVAYLASKGRYDLLTPAITRG